MCIVKHDSLTHWKVISLHTLSLWIKRIINMMDGLISQNLLWSSICSFLFDPLTQPLSSFFSLLLASTIFPVCLFVKQLCTVGFCLPAIKWTSIIFCSDMWARAWAMCFRVSVCVCVRDIDPGFTQLDGQAEWLIGARQSDLRQGEHTHTSYSSRSTGAVISHVMPTAMHEKAQQKAWLDTLLAIGIERGRKSLAKGSMSWRQDEPAK